MLDYESVICKNPMLQVGEKPGASQGGRLTCAGTEFLVSSREKSRTRRERYNVFDCDCGESCIVRTRLVASGRTKSCGCLSVEYLRSGQSGENGPGYEHGLRCHPLYNVFTQIKQRCLNTYSDSYKDYGAKGVEIFAEWLQGHKGLLAFITWAEANGWKLGLEIHRNGDKGNYEPTNCRFVTKSENIAMRNRGGF